MKNSLSNSHYYALKRQFELFFHYKDPSGPPHGGGGGCRDSSLGVPGRAPQNHKTFHLYYQFAGKSIPHLKHVSVSVFGSKSEISPLNLLNLIHGKKLESIFVSVTIAIRIFLTLPVTVACGERALSGLDHTLKTW